MGVSKSWGDARILEDVSLALDAGSATWVGGRNGAGKTTMLRIAAGLIEPEGGLVRAFGLCPAGSRSTFQRLVSFLPAGDRGLYARLTVHQQLEFCARINLTTREQIPLQVAGALTDFDLSELARRRVDRMSMGQRQRLRLAITLMCEPRVLLLDEPLTSLDAEGTQLVLAAVARVRARGGAVLWCSPSGEQPEFDLDSAYALRDGRLEAL
jgi:ABC-type multidrug transport system ATPase subunit